MRSVTCRTLRDLLERRAARTGAVTLSSGEASNFYFDCKNVTLSPDGAYLAGTAFLDTITQLGVEAEAIGGPSHGADPIISSVVVLSHLRRHPLNGFTIRTERKAHGMRQRIDNLPAPGTRAVIVDDVVTSGASLLESVRLARDAGCEVVAALALVDRGEQDGAARIRSEVEPYIPLFTRRDFPRLCETTDQRAGT